MFSIRTIVMDLIEMNVNVALHVIGTLYCYTVVSPTFHSGHDYWYLLYGLYLISDGSVLSAVDLEGDMALHVKHTYYYH
jgi:hypothetical protein